MLATSNGWSPFSKRRDAASWRRSCHRKFLILSRGNTRFQMHWTAFCVASRIGPEGPVWSAPALSTGCRDNSTECALIDNGIAAGTPWLSAPRAERRIRINRLSRSTHYHRIPNSVPCLRLVSIARSNAGVEYGFTLVVNASLIFSYSPGSNRRSRETLTLSFRMLLSGFIKPPIPHSLRAISYK